MNCKKIIIAFAIMTMIFSLAACTNGANNSPSSAVPTAEPKVPETSIGIVEPTVVTGTQNVVVEGFEWGPATTKVILTLDHTINASSVTAESFEVMEVKESLNWAAFSDPSADMSAHITVESPRNVLAAYSCDSQGNASGDSEYLALELSYNPDEGNPYCYDLLTSKNTPCDPYELQITLTESAALKTTDGDAVADLNVDAKVDLAKAIYPQLEGVDLSGVFSGTDGKSLTYASYAPVNDGEKHPLVVWLHGAGEGGTDVSIPLLGNEVTALYSEEFQSVMGGAYVLTPQTPTFWMTYNEEGE